MEPGGSGNRADAGAGSVGGVGTGAGAGAGDLFDFGEVIRRCSNWRHDRIDTLAVHFRNADRNQIKATLMQKAVAIEEEAFLQSYSLCRGVQHQFWLSQKSLRYTDYSEGIYNYKGY